MSEVAPSSDTNADAQSEFRGIPAINSRDTPPRNKRSDLGIGNLTIASPQSLDRSLESPEVALRRERDLLLSLLRTTERAILVIDASGTIIFANDALEPLLNLSKATILHRPYQVLLDQIMDLEGQPLVMEPLVPGAELCGVVGNPTNRKYLSITVSLLKDSQDPNLSLMLAITDITDQWQAKQVLQQHVDLYRQMFETNGAVKLLIDPTTGAIVDANTAACRFYGYSLEELQQKRITDLNADPPAQVQARMQDTLQQQQHYWLFQHRLASGEVRDVEVYASILELHGRQLLHSIIHDVTERRQAEAALRLQTEQERLVGGIMQRIRQSLDLKEILQVTVEEVRQCLQADRVLIYRFDATLDRNSVVVESCLLEYPPLLGWQMGATSLDTTALNSLTVDTIQAIADITQSDLDPGYIELLQLFEVAAQLMIPIWLGDQLWGLLIAHQCQAPRVWKPQEIDLLRRIETQLVVAIQQAEIYQRLQQFNTQLEIQVQERTAQLQKALGFEAVLKRITDRVRDSLDEGAILQAAVKELALLFRAGRCSAALYDLSQSIATIHYEHTTHLPPSPVRSLCMQDFPEIYQRLTQGQHLQFCPQLSHSLAEPSVVLACPILDDHGVLGHLWLVHHQDYEFKDREIRLVKQVANQCAIALRQSRLYQAAQAQVSELAKLNRLKDDFLSTISHELRTPLASIRMAVQLLEMLLNSLLPLNDQPLGSPEAKVNHCLGILREECDREINLISDLLTLQQLEAGTQPLTPTPILLQAWIPQLVETIEPLVQSHRQTLQVQLAPNLPPLISDLFLLNQVLQELLRNACKFTPAGGAITIAVRFLTTLPTTPPKLTGETLLPCWQLWVSNTGVEISTSELQRIFDQFYRVPSQDPWKHGGIGLGLALVKRMVDYLNGQVYALSDQGQTTVIVELPHLTPSPNRPSIPEPLLGNAANF